MTDEINHPTHYTSHPSGIECIDITMHQNFCTGNAIKYLWRAGRKGDPLTDLKKSLWYMIRSDAVVHCEAIDRFLKWSEENLTGGVSIILKYLFTRGPMFTAAMLETYIQSEESFR